MTIDDSPNSCPFLSPADVPGYRMEYSINQPSNGRMISELWLKYASDGTETGGKVKISVFPVNNKDKAFELAERLYYAITDKNQGTAIGRPTPGSLTGVRIGNFCWAYTVGFVPRITPRKGATIMFVQRAYFVRLQVEGGGEAVEDAFVDGLGRKVADTLKTWSRPPGFPPGEDYDRDDD